MFNIDLEELDDMSCSDLAKTIIEKLSASTFKSYDSYEVKELELLLLRKLELERNKFTKVGKILYGQK